MSSATVPCGLGAISDKPGAATVPPVRRLLAIVLLALLPLQFSWAAVAPYCGHEMDSVGHFGHHEHHHRADAAPATGDVTDGAASGEQTPGDVDADCGHCHGTCSAMPFLH